MSKPEASDYPDIAFMTAAVRSWLVNQLITDQDLDELGYLLLELGYPDPPAAGLRDFLKREMSRLAAEGSPARARLILLCEGLIQFYLLHHPRETPELDQLNRFLPPGLSFSNLSGRLLFEAEHYYQPHNLFVQEQSRWYLDSAPSHKSSSDASTNASTDSSTHPRRQGEKSPARAVPDATAASRLMPDDMPIGMTKEMTDEAQQTPDAAHPPGPEPRLDSAEPRMRDRPVPAHRSEAPETEVATAGNNGGNHAGGANGGPRPAARASQAEAAAEAASGRSAQFRDIRNRRLQLLKEWETHHGQA